MTDHIPSLDCIEKGQCFPQYLYEKNGKHKDGITDTTLHQFQTHYQTQAISKDQIFHYIYAILHSPDYRTPWANNLSKELPRIPFAATVADFYAFAAAGKTLGDLHCGFEHAPPYPQVKLHIHKKACTTLDDLQPHDFRVEKMKHGKTGRDKDRTTIIYNPHISIHHIPEAAYQYIVNGRSAIEWVMERQCNKTDKDSGIVSDANQYAVETLNNPRYPLELLLRVITVSLETLDVVQGLPKLTTQR